MPGEGDQVENGWCAPPTKDRTPNTRQSHNVAVDEEVLSLVTSDEATAVTPRMSCIFLSLLGAIPEDTENSLPIAQEWLLEFSGGGNEFLSAKQLLQRVVGGIDERELQQALEWMQQRHIIDLRNEGGSLYLTIRNALPICADMKGANHSFTE